jgi:putative phosphoserine phosphatase/1-acylglycerol-3-phosphate O-acyltransferase
MKIFSSPADSFLTKGKAMKVRPICFFDMDRTLIATNSGVSFVRYSLRRGKTTRWIALKSMLDYIRYRYDLLDMNKAYRDSLKLLLGIREEELTQFCQEWFEEEVKNLIYPQAFDFVRQHRAGGETVVIISNAITYTVQPLARYLGINHILGTRLEVCKGLFTGNYIEPLCFRDGKIYWAEKLIRELGGEFSASTFYSDSITDLPLLERVGNPRIVNPDSRLQVLAKKRGWPIHVFRLSHPGKKIRGE